MGICSCQEIEIGLNQDIAYNYRPLIKQRFPF